MKGPRGAGALCRVLFTCGNGETGKLGHGGLFSTKLFTACGHLPDVDVRAVSCGNAHTTVLTDCGTVFTCGSNHQLQLGHSKDLKEVPVPLEVDIPEKVVSVSSGGAFTLAVTDSGGLYGWGDNTHGQVGTNNTAAQVAVPTRIPGLPKIAKVATGDRHALAVSEDGEVLAWGANHSGQLGSQHTGLKSWFQAPRILSPRLIRELLASQLGSKVVDIAAGSAHSLVATESGCMYGMGTNKWWQLGLPNSENFAEPMLVPNSCSVKTVSAGMSSSGALDATGRLLMWGTDTMSAGLLPEREEEPTETAFRFSPQYRAPTPVKAPLLSQVSIGFGAAAGITMHGRLATWGWSGYSNQGTWLDRAHGAVEDGGQLGHGDRSNVKYPKLVRKLALDTSGQGSRCVSFEDSGSRMHVESVSCGMDHMAAVVTVDERLVTR